MDDRGVPSLLATLLLAATLAACSADPPKIISVVPGRGGTDVATNQDIKIDFDRPMDHASVENRFELQPALAGCTAASHCRFVWTKNALIFTHQGVNLDP